MATNQPDTEHLTETVVFRADSSERTTIEGAALALGVPVSKFLRDIIVEGALNVFTGATPAQLDEFILKQHGQIDAEAAGRHAKVDRVA